MHMSTGLHTCIDGSRAVERRRRQRRTTDDDGSGGGSADDDNNDDGMAIMTAAAVLARTMATRTTAAAAAAAVAAAAVRRSQRSRRLVARPSAAPARVQLCMHACVCLCVHAYDGEVAVTVLLVVGINGVGERKDILVAEPKGHLTIIPFICIVVVVVVVVVIASSLPCPLVQHFVLPGNLRQSPCARTCMHIHVYMWP